MANITKRTTKTGSSYLIRVFVDQNSNGKQKIQSMTWKPAPGMTEKQIQKELTRQATMFEEKVKNGNYANVSNMKLYEFIPQYFDITGDKLALLTVAKYKRAIELYINPALGHLKLSAIRPIHIQQFIQQLERDDIRADGKGAFSPSSIRRYLVILQSIFKCAYKLGMIASNPTESARLTLPEMDEPEVEVFTKEEAVAMLECLESEPLKYQVLIQLAILTGCRRGELVALQWDCIDLEQKTISIKQSAYQLTGEEVKTKAPKTKKSFRTVSIPAYAVELLKQYRIEQLQERLKLGDRWHEGGWVFTQWDGKPMYPTTPTQWFSRFLKRHNLPHRKFHALRHTSATLLLSNGTNIKTVASRLGHTQLSTTNRYLHALQEADVKAADTLQDLFANPTHKMA